MFENFEDSGKILDANAVTNEFLSNEQWKMENGFEATKLGRKMQFLDLWVDGVLPLDVIENLDMGVFQVHGIYDAWKEAGQNLTPRFVNTHRYLWRDNPEFEEWVDNSNTKSTSWLEESIKNNVCPPLLLTDKKLFGLGSYIDGRHRAMIFSRLALEGKLDNSKIPVIIGHIPKVYWYLYNFLLYSKSSFSKEDKNKILFDSLELNKGYIEKGNRWRESAT